MKSKESAKVRYAYGVAAALLLGGTAFSIASGPVGAQVAQNAPVAMPPGGAPMSFADLSARLQPAVVNISTKQRVAVRQQQPIRSKNCSASSARRSRSSASSSRAARAPARPARWARASSFRPTATSSPTTT